MGHKRIVSLIPREYAFVEEDEVVKLARSTTGGKSWESIPAFGQSATFIVAASDSLHKERADYVCPGVDDQVVIQAVIDALPSDGGKVGLLEGVYIKSNTTGISVPSNVEIEIIGTIKFVDNIDADAQIFINSDAVSGNSNIAIRGNGILDGNRANNNSGEQTAIKFTKVENSIIDISMKNFRSYHVQEINPGTGNKITNREFPNVSIRKATQSRLGTHSLWEPLSDFETDWVDTAGTITYDTNIKHRGTRSVKMVSVLGDKATIDKAVTKDMSSKGFSIWYYTEDANKIFAIFLYLRSGGNWTQFETKHLRGESVSNKVVNNKWTCIGDGDSSITGNFDITNVDMIRLVITAKSGEIATVWFDDLCYATQSIARNGMITISLDDGYESDYTKAKQYLDKYNYPACSAIISSKVGETNRLTKTQLEELQDCGWDILDHSLTHAGTKNGINVIDSYALLEEEMLGMQDWLIQNGFAKGARFYIYPYGYHSKKSLEIQEKYFVAARIGGLADYGIPLPVPDCRTITTKGVFAVTELSVVQGYIDKTYNSKHWLVLHLHEIVDSGATAGQVNKALFEAIIDYIHSKNMPVVTFSEVFDDILFAPTQTGQYTDLFMDVLAVSATHVRSNEDLSAATPITFTIDAQPDVPRTLSWAFDTHAQITEYDMEVIGVDAKGNTVTETLDETAGWSGETSNAFATITSIKMTSRTGTGAADTMDIGITDVLGISNVIYETGDVYKIKKNNANATVAAAQVNTTYDTYDMAVIGLAATDDFTIWFKSNLNIIS